MFKKTALLMIFSIQIIHMGLKGDTTCVASGSYTDSQGYSCNYCETAKGTVYSPPYCKPMTPPTPAPAPTPAAPKTCCSCQGYKSKSLLGDIHGKYSTPYEVTAGKTCNNDFCRTSSGKDHVTGYHAYTVDADKPC